MAGEIDLDEDALPLGRTPDAPVPVKLRFSWDRMPPAAAFRYGEEVWLVFDRALEQGLDRVIEDADLGFSDVRQIDSDHGSALIFTLPTPQVTVRLDQEEYGWIADFRPRANLPRERLEPEILNVSGSSVIRFASEQAGNIHWLADELRDERLIVVPLGDAGLGTSMTNGYPQFQALRSQQGLVLRPTSDGIEVAVTPNGILVRHKDGLLVSSTETRELLPLDVSERELGRRLFRLSRWRRGDEETFDENKHRLTRLAVLAGSEERAIAHLDLARFYFAWGLGTETIGLLNLIEGEAPERARDPELLLMRAVSAFIIEDYETAGRLLADPALAGEREALLWQSAYSAVVQDWQAAASGYAEADGLIATYPPRVRNDLLIWGAEARLGVGDTGGTSEYLIALSRFNMNKSEAARAKYLTGLRFRLEGEEDLALSLWRDLKDDDHPAPRARARLGLLEHAIDAGEIDNAAAIEELEKLRFSWRGDDFERALMVRLASLYEEERRYRDALVTLQHVAARFPEYERAGQVTRRMGEIFVKVFEDENAKPIPPVEALALFERFKELTPTGDAGERIVSRLADRLVEMDLLERAAELLDDQLRFRLEGEGKVRVGAKLALVAIMNRDPSTAITALDNSPESDVTLQDLRTERSRLRARALGLKGKYREALAALGEDEDGEAMKLRAEFLWRLEDWKAAALALGRLVPPEPAGDSLEEAEADRIMNLAIALTMAEDRVRLIELYKAYGEQMALTKHKSSFRLLAGDAGSGNRKSIAEGLEQVDRVQDFYQEYRSQL